MLMFNTYRCVRGQRLIRRAVGCSLVKERMGIKRELQHRVVDPLQFRFDAFPTLYHQPLLG